MIDIEAIKETGKSFVLVYEFDTWSNNSDEIVWLINFKIKKLTVPQKCALAEELRCIAGAIERGSFNEDAC